MIPVTPQPEPADFDAAVRKPGLAYFAANGIAPDRELPKGTKIPSYWRTCLDGLYTSYHGVCAYLAIHFERITGAGSVDHFIAKSRLPREAYEWSNYRLACMAMNARKREFDDVLDPFTLPEETFFLEFLTGEIYPNPRKDALLQSAAQQTIDRLSLNEPDIRRKRTSDFWEYVCNGIAEEHLKRNSPFVWYEAKRQGLL